MAKNLKLQTRVRVKGSDRQGTICPDFMGMIAPSDGSIPVVLDGDDYSTSYMESELEELGPEGAECDAACGIGQGADCCIFITGAPGGFSCERFGAFRWSLVVHRERMIAQREPTAPYLHCKLQ